MRLDPSFQWPWKMAERLHTERRTLAFQPFNGKPRAGDHLSVGPQRPEARKIVVEQDDAAGFRRRSASGTS